ncbi:hypothetical protein FRC12_012123 [Ceratobasidium sp. 428]|nr:hypothetical protein FRC12_012123 [Ceratobasidium sp. 428]
MKAEDLATYTDQDPTERRQELIDIATKYRLIGTGPDQILIFDVDDFAERRGGKNKKWLGKTINGQQILDAGFLSLTRGTSYGYRLTNGKQQVVFAAKFTQFKTMSEAQLAKVTMLGKHFKRTFELFNPIKSNGAHKDGGLKGEMSAEGYRAGYEKDVDFGAYKIKKRLGLDQAAIAATYRKHTDEMKDVAAYYEESYENLCPVARKHSLEWMDEFQMPEYGATKIIFDRSNPDYVVERTVSGSNLTVTRYDFSNVFHRDNDASPFSFGIWFLTDSDGKPVIDKDATRTAVDGGQFVLPEFKIAVDFGGCAGQIDMMWRGSQDLHATARSRTKAGYMRFGTSTSAKSDFPVERS